jgi:chromosomal replication initiator protein
MTLSPTDIWSRLLDRARLELPDQTIRTWLEPAEALEHTGTTLHAGVPDQFAADWNNSKYADLLAGLAPVALGFPVSVVFKVHEETRKRSQMDLFVSSPQDTAARAGTASGIAGSLAAPLNSRYTFQQFVIGKSNELAAAAAQAVAEAPGKVYNPLFIYGDTGLGKTHLMQAIAHRILERRPETRLIYIGTEQFTNEMVSAIQTRTNAEFRRRFRETDLLLIDDVHFLRSKEGTQEEFFHTFNALYEAGRQIVLTSDRSPSEIPALEARLVSRFQWGMVADIALPDLEHRIAILQQKAQVDRLELTIPDDVIHFVAENVRSSVRELEGSIIKLLAYASLKHRDVTVSLAREALRDKLHGQPGSGDAPAESLTVAVIQHAVAREWGVTVDGLKSKTRTRSLTIPRHIAMYLSRELLGMQLAEIGVAFGGRDHSTVIHALERVADVLGRDSTLTARVTRLRDMLRSLRAA